MQSTERDVIDLAMHVDGMPRYNDVHIATNESRDIDVRRIFIVLDVYYFVNTQQHSVVNKTYSP